MGEGINTGDLVRACGDRAGGAGWVRMHNVRAVSCTARGMEVLRRVFCTEFEAGFFQIRGEGS